MHSSLYLLQQIIKPSLQFIGVSEASEAELVLATAIIESQLGQSQRQSQRHGLFQIHALSHRHLWDHYLVQHPQLASDVRGLASQHAFLKHPHLELDGNLAYSCVLCYCLYLQHGYQPKQDQQRPLLDLWQHFYRHAHGPSSADAASRLATLWPQELSAATLFAANGLQIGA